MGLNVTQIGTAFHLEQGRCCSDKKRSVTRNEIRLDVKVTGFTDVFLSSPVRFCNRKKRDCRFRSLAVKMIIGDWYECFLLSECYISNDGFRDR